MIDKIISLKNPDKIIEIINKVKISTLNYGEIVFFTNGNDWYIPTLIKNLVKSMEIHEPKYKIIVFCTDSSGYEKCKDIGFEYFEFVDIPDLMISNVLSDSDASTDHYTRLCFAKTVIMKFILDLGYTSFYIDPDMAFVKPSVDNLLSYLDKNDFVCAGQNHYVNSNIMLAKSTEDNKRLFELPISELNRILEDKNLHSDEDMLRPRLINKQFGCIDFYKYPPGNIAVQYKDYANMIHANYYVGLENKINLMKECNAWFI
jgi:hypothetical protein